MVARAPAHAGAPVPLWCDHLLEPQLMDWVDLCLGGHSALDQHRLRFRNETDVDRFLRTCGAEPASSFDRDRLAHLHRESLRYLQRQLGYRCPEDVASPRRVRDLFLIASEESGFPRRRTMACVLLKVMHLIDHIEARVLRARTPITEAELAGSVLRGLVRASHQAREAGAPIAVHEGGRKQRDALLTKLLLRRDAAALIPDRVRFRVITESRDQIVPVLAWLLRYHLPFNQILARESVNNLVDLRDWLSRHAGLGELVDALQLPPADEGVVARRINDHSSPSFGVVNFVLELPVRIDLIPRFEAHSFVPSSGRVVYVTTELQLLDEQTHQLNELGDSAHEAYKARQLQAVDRRLREGTLERARVVDDVV